MEFNLGDRVKIKNDLKFKEYEITPTMQLDMGKIAKIIKKDFDIFNQEYSYQLKIDGKESVFNWYGFMLEPLKETTDKIDVEEMKIKYFEGATKLKYNPNGDMIDVYAREDVFIPQFEMRLVPLGFAMELPKGKKAMLYPRSSTFKTWGCIQTNSVGVIDESYNGDNDEWKEPLLCINPKDEKYVSENVGVKTYQRGTWIRKGDKIAQFEIVDKMERTNIREVEHLNNTDRGGFGSTGSR